MWLGWLAYLAILLTYRHMVTTGSARPFHWANALGCVPLALLTIPGWPETAPQIALTMSFGVIAVSGLLRDRHERKVSA